MMKRHNTYPLILTVATLAAAVLLPAACASDEALSGSTETQAIRLTAGCQAPTRGTSGKTSQENAFDTGAWLSVTITPSSGAAICTDAIFKAEKATAGKNALTPPDATRPPYFPDDVTKTVTIKAFYPSTVKSTDTEFSVQLDQTKVSNNETEDAYKRSDLMTATVTAQAKTDGEVELQFTHRMARVTINATATDGLTVESISLTNVQTKAVYTASNDKWNGTGSTGTITVAKDGSDATLSGVALFPPQTITGTTFIQVVTNKGTANYVVTSKEFQEGHDYTAELQVGLQNLTTTAAITDWNEATGTATVTKVNKYGIAIDPISETFTYDGTAKIPESIKVWFKQAGKDDTPLVINTDYTLEFYNNTDVGEALIVAAGKAGTTYEGSAAVQSFVIGKATPSATFNSAGTVTREYSWNDTYTNSLVAGSKYDGVTTWTSSQTDIATVDGNGMVSILKPGTTVIKFSTDGSGNYESVSAQYTLVISKRSFKNHVQITGLGDYDATYNGQAKEPVAVVHDGTKRLGDNDGYYTVTYGNNVAAGTTAYVTCTGGGTFYDNTVITKTFTINKVTPVITMDTSAKTIGIGTTYQCEATTTYGTITYSSNDPEVATVVETTGLVTARKAGTAVITASVKGGDNWNAAADKKVSITVQLQEEKWTSSGRYVYTCPADAIYTFEVVGAAGGSYYNGLGGKGGIVTASQKLTKGTVIYVYVGAAGTGGYSQPGGQNGSTGTYLSGYGGKGGTMGGGSGGACSEIRIGSEAIASRQIVAGGGGGSSGSRRSGKDGGSSSAGNYAYSYGQDVTLTSTGGGGGGGYRGGQQGNWMGGGYGGSNYAAKSWNIIKSGVSTNGPTSTKDTKVYNGHVYMTYEFE